MCIRDSIMTSYKHTHVGGKRERRRKCVNKISQLREEPPCRRTDRRRAYRLNKRYGTERLNLRHLLITFLNDLWARNKILFTKRYNAIYSATELLCLRRERFRFLCSRRSYNWFLFFIFSITRMEG